MNARTYIQHLTRKLHFTRFFAFNGWRTFHSTNKLWSQLSKCISKSCASSHGSLIFLRKFSEVAKTKQNDISSLITVPSLKFEDLCFGGPVSHEELITALKDCKNVGEQMQILVSTLALSPEDIEKRIIFCKTLEKLFKPFFTNFKIQMFGSSVNGFGFKGCDIDMTFESNASEKDIPVYLEKPDIPLVSEVLGGKVSVQELSELPPREQLLFIHTVLLEFYKETEEPILFINAHVPLVRFYHDKFNLKCDLTFKNRVAYANSKMLYLFAKLDPRVVPLMMTLRYWAKHTGIIGKGLLFNTYTISLLVIHFLQTCTPPVLPSANHVISLTDSFEIDDMSDTSFLDIISKISPSKNTKRSDELLRDFFFYYLYFDFTRVICPSISGSISRDEFFSREENRKFRMNSICVQDPMCLKHNVAELVDFKSCKKLFNELVVACKVFQDETMRSPSEKPWGLLAILDRADNEENVFEQKLVSVTVPRGHLSSLQMSEVIVDLLQRVLLIDCKVMELAEVLSMLRVHDDVVQQQKQIIEKVAEKQKFLLLLKSKMKKKKDFSVWALKGLPDDSLLKHFQDAFSKQELILCAECKVSQNVWLGRDLIDVKPASCLLERERLVSEEVAKANKQNLLDKKIKPFVFLLECYASDDTAILVNFRPLQRMSFNPILGIFLKEYIPKVISHIEKFS